MAEASRYFYQAPPVERTLLSSQVNDANRVALDALLAEFGTIDWKRETIGAAIKAAAAHHALKPPQVMMPLRALVAGTLATPAIDAVLELVGRDATRERMAAGLAAG